MKRIFDFLGAFILLILLSPVLLVVALIIRFNLGTPILFRQLRPGLCGKEFTIYKFRTMTDWKDEKGNLLPADIRLTTLGRQLRRLSLDELPQLFNVIKGNMSFVGPRPLLMEYLPLYSTEQARRHEVKPGITGWAQVNGRNTVSWEEKFRFDVWYVDNQSFVLDIKILLMTLRKVVNKQDIDQNPKIVGMEPFRGSRENV